MSKKIPDAVVVFHIGPEDTSAMYDLLVQKDKKIDWSGLYYIEPEELCDVGVESAKILSKQYGIEFVQIGSQDLNHAEHNMDKLCLVLNKARKNKYAVFEFNPEKKTLEKYPSPNN